MVASKEEGMVRSLGESGVSEEDVQKAYDELMKVRKHGDALEQYVTAYGYLFTNLETYVECHPTFAEEFKTLREDCEKKKKEYTGQLKIMVETEDKIEKELSWLSAMYESFDDARLTFSRFIYKERFEMNWCFYDIRFPQGHDAKPCAIKNAADWVAGYQKRVEKVNRAFTQFEQGRGDVSESLISEYGSMRSSVQNTLQLMSLSAINLVVGTINAMAACRGKGTTLGEQLSRFKHLGNKVKPQLAGEVSTAFETFRDRVGKHVDSKKKDIADKVEKTEFLARLGFWGIETYYERLGDFAKVWADVSSDKRAKGVEQGMGGSTNVPSEVTTANDKFLEQLEMNYLKDGVKKYEYAAVMSKLKEYMDSTAAFSKMFKKQRNEYQYVEECFLDRLEKIKNFINAENMSTTAALNMIKRGDPVDDWTSSEWIAGRGKREGYYPEVDELRDAHRVMSISAMRFVYRTKHSRAACDRTRKALEESLDKLNSDGGEIEGKLAGDVNTAVSRVRERVEDENSTQKDIAEKVDEFEKAIYHRFNTDVTIP
eukprot:GHVS01013510.1.p1 GENE.GHVS01013510.1~~GHVS01013510.1.p1  ORF type:complete len:542 (-),score=74.95 GHVS01013510.1:99-1724(-)